MDFKESLSAEGGAPSHWMSGGDRIEEPTKAKLLEDAISRLRSLVRLCLTSSSGYRADNRPHRVVHAGQPVEDVAMRRSLREPERLVSLTSGDSGKPPLSDGPVRLLAWEQLYLFTY